MAEYRAYVLGVEGRVLRAVELVYPDDDTAKEYTEKFVDRHFVELWRVKLNLARFEPKQK
jgi:hypothetical protein